jgi:hypothetical protein
VDLAGGIAPEHEVFPQEPGRDRLPGDAVGAGHGMPMLSFDHGK